jgi:hypothetical protein
MMQAICGVMPIHSQAFQAFWRHLGFAFVRQEWVVKRRGTRAVGTRSYTNN